MARASRRAQGRRFARMASLCPWRITLARDESPADRRARLSGRLVLAGALGALWFAVGVPPASATSNGSTTVSLNANVPVRSVTVGPATTSFNACTTSGGTTGATLNFPNGNCVTTGANDVVITNGAIAGHIYVTGTDATPSDAGQHWVLCNGPNSASCTGPSGGPFGANYPGQNQIEEWTMTSAGVNGSTLGSVPSCDEAFNLAASGAFDCSAAINQQTTEGLSLLGPSLSTDTSSSWQTTWTWTAVP